MFNRDKREIFEAGQLLWAICDSNHTFHCLLTEKPVFKRDSRSSKVANVHIRNRKLEFSEEITLAVLLQDRRSVFSILTFECMAVDSFGWSCDGQEISKIEAVIFRTIASVHGEHRHSQSLLTQQDKCFYLQYLQSVF